MPNDERGELRLELKPCPFCGGKAERHDIGEEDAEEANVGGSVIECKKCGGSTRVFFGEKVGLEDAWQTRAPTREKAAPEDGEVREAFAVFENDQGLSNSEHAVSWLNYILGAGELKSAHKKKFDAVVSILRAAGSRGKG